MALVLTSAACGLNRKDPSTSAGPGIATRAAANDTIAASSADSNSGYCNEAGSWAARELTPHDESSTAAERTYLTEYAAFIDRSVAAAPAAIRADWTGVQAFTRTAVEVMARYDYLGDRVEKQGTEADKAAMHGNDEQHARYDRISAYDAKVCGTTQPSQADVKFHGNKASAFCKAQKATTTAFQHDVVEGGFQVDAVRTWFEAPSFLPMFDTAARLAPAEVKPDVLFDKTFTRTTFLPTLQRYGYDLRKILVAGSSEDRHVFNFVTADAAPHYARLFTYESQVCEI
jgi:hypothetical protein